jgi:predicted phage terminase large subunit-like protein
MRWIPSVNARFTQPLHLAPYVDALERSEREPVHVTVSVPPRHMKTETTKAACARRLRINPKTKIAYVTYAGSIALKFSRGVKTQYERSGGRVIQDANTQADWRTTDTGTDDGGLWATSVGGAITGEGFDLIIVDDAVKSRALAESGLEREKLVDWFRDTLTTREEPGASTIVLGARWTPYDLIGVLQSEGWHNITLPAINAKGEALCPERYPLSELLKIKERIGTYGWQSLYMGEPISKGGRVFGDTRFYDVLPTDIESLIIGLDLNYTKKSYADYSVAVVLAQANGYSYVLEVIREQLTAPEFFAKLADLRARHPYAVFTGFFSGTERGTLDMMKERGIAVEVKPAVLDKFSRCQPVAAAWNAGKILLPREAPWLDAFVTEVCGFTGVRDRHDDQVDALSGAYEESSGFDWMTAMRSIERNRDALEREWAEPSVFGSGVTVRRPMFCHDPGCKRFYLSHCPYGHRQPIPNNDHEIVDDDKFDDDDDDDGEAA